MDGSRPCSPSSQLLRCAILHLSTTGYAHQVINCLSVSPGNLAPPENGPSQPRDDHNDRPRTVESQTRSNFLSREKGWFGVGFVTDPTVPRARLRPHRTKGPWVGWRKKALSFVRSGGHCQSFGLSFCQSFFGKGIPLGVPS
jgi:hypothetical protein